MALARVVRDDFSTPFFDAAAEGILLLRYSPSRDTWSEPAAVLCSTTQADDLVWREASRRGRLVSWTVKPGRATDSGRSPDVVLALVETDEGPWLPLWVPEADTESLAVGRAVEIFFDRSDEDSDWLPVARTL